MNIKMFVTRRSYRVRLYYFLVVLGLFGALYFLLFSGYPCSGCELYRLKRKVTHGQYDCTLMDFNPETLICLQPLKRDRLSQHIHNDGVWEPHMVRRMQGWLRGDPSLGLIDVGANIGVYTLVAAHMGHQVLAIEPNMENVLRMHRTVSLGGLEDKITLLRNAIGEERGVGRLIVPHSSIAYAAVGHPITSAQTDTSDKWKFANIIFMDDVLGYCKFKRAILKIDIAGYDHHVMTHADLLFRKIDIPYIMMEFGNIKPDYMKHDEKQKVGHMIAYLHHRGYVPKDVNGVALNHPAHWDKWPDHVIFELDRRRVGAW